MRIAISILPLKTAHKDRGTGFYTSNLVANLKKDQQIQIQEFLHSSEVKEADIIHYPWFDFFFHTLPIRKKLKTIVTVHDVIPLMFPQKYPTGYKGKFNLFLQKLALKSSSHILTDSNVSKSDISRYLQINENKISAIHLAANNNFKIQPYTKLIYVKRKYKLPDRFLLYVGDANWVKNLPFLIKGFEKVLKVPGLEDVNLILVGAVFLKNVENINHPELRDLKQVNELISTPNVKSNIIKAGDLDLDDLVSFYNLATVYIQPSLYEGFGLPLIEAFSSGTPVMSSDRGSLKEIGGDAAVYFNPDNLNQFAAILVEVLRDRALQKRLSKLGLIQGKKYSWERVAEETKMIYSKVKEND